MLERNEEVVKQVKTNGQFFVNVFSDGSIGVESINGGGIRGSQEDFIELFPEVMGVIRATRKQR